jgi:hypothetical protein
MLGRPTFAQVAIVVSAAESIATGVLVLFGWPCVNQGPPEACYFFGSLSGGAACNEGLQCESGWCTVLSRRPSHAPSTPRSREDYCGTGAGR